MQTETTHMRRSASSSSKTTVPLGDVGNTTITNGSSSSSSHYTDANKHGTASSKQRHLVRRKRRKLFSSSSSSSKSRKARNGLRIVLCGTCFGGFILFTLIKVAAWALFSSDEMADLEAPRAGMSRRVPQRQHPDYDREGNKLSWLQKVFHKDNHDRDHDYIDPSQYHIPNALDHVGDKGE
eukprot:scaffold12984_cov58-Attheya_sp.AAC.1